VSLRRGLELLYLDLWDALRPPAFDIMLLVVAVLAGALTVMEPVTSAEASISPDNGLNPVYLSLFVAVLYVALRGSSDLVNVVQSGVMQVYMSYPVSRATVATVLYVTRVLLPAALLLGLPGLIVGIVLYPVVAKDVQIYLALWASYLLQSQMYGAAFLLMSSRLRSSGTAMVASVSFYFGYITLSTLLDVIGFLDNVKQLVWLSDAMGFHYALYYYISGQGEPAWTLFLVPAIYVVLMAAYFTYMVRGFEPT
jgi:ABC-2 type transport system permease protein